MGLLGALWGVAGVLLLLAYAIFRLTPPTIEAFSYHFWWYHWAILLLNTALVAYLKGYRGFQKGLSPRIAARAKYINNHPNVLRLLMGPFYCIGYFHIIKKKQIITILMTIAMVILILLIRLLNQPWRGIIDAGVVIALSWGFISLLIFSIQAFTSEVFDYSPQVPEEHP